MKDRARDGTCRRREEEKARRERKWKKDMRVLEGILELKVANEVAEFAGQFFDLVEHNSDDSVPTGVLIDIHEAEDPLHLPGSSQRPPVDLPTGMGSTIFAGTNYLESLYEFE